MKDKDRQRLMKGVFKFLLNFLNDFSRDLIQKPKSLAAKIVNVTPITALPSQNGLISNAK